MEKVSSVTAQTRHWQSPWCRCRRGSAQTLPTRQIYNSSVEVERNNELTNILFVHIGEEAEELFETNWELEVDNFDDMGLKEEVLRGIYAFGFKEPSPIQQKGILPVIQGKDTIA